MSAFCTHTAVSRARSVAVTATETNAAIAAWPTLMPPSFGGIAACTSTSSPWLSRPDSTTLGEPGVLEHPAGQHHGVEASVTASCRAQLDRRASECLVEAAAISAVVGTRVEIVERVAAISGGGIEHEVAVAVAVTIVRPS